MKKKIGIMVLMAVLALIAVYYAFLAENYKKACIFYGSYCKILIYVAGW